MTEQQDPAASPFAQAALPLLKLGWSPIPLPAGAKAAPPVGYTGRNARVPSAADIADWISEGVPYGDPAGPRWRPGNVGVHVPRGVVGIDVDAYDAKRGADTMRVLTAELGRLPRTVVTTRRAPGDVVSGIRWFRLAAFVELDGNLEAAQPDGTSTRDVEVIQPHHRYAVFPPSVVKGMTYAVLDQRGATPQLVSGAHGALSLLQVDSLPLLPQAWAERFTARQQGGDVVDPSAVPVRLTPGQPDIEVSRVLDDVLRELRGGSRHDSMLPLVMVLVRFAEQGRPGIAAAVDRCRRAFLDSVERDGSRTPAAASSEWERMVQGAALKVASNPTARLGGFAEMLAAEGLSLPQAAPAPRPAPLAAPAAAVALEAARSTVSAALPEGPATLDALLAAVAVDTSTEREPSSWSPVDIGTVIAGGLELDEPELWAWGPEDGQRLLYRGKVHTIIGAPGGWKSFATLHAVADVVRGGGRALVIDAEEEPKILIGRLLELGLTVDQLTGGVVLVNPTSDFMASSEREAVDELMGQQFDIAVIDSFTQVSVFSGVEANDSKDVSRWYTELPIRLARRTGAAVLIVDHLAKSAADGSRYASGSGAKLALPVVTYSVVPGQPGPSRYIEGRAGSGIGHVSLVVAKDRYGFIGGQGTSFRFDIDSTGERLDIQQKLRRISVAVSMEDRSELTDEQREQRAEAERSEAFDRARQRRIQQAMVTMRMNGGSFSSIASFERAMGGKKDGPNGCMAIAEELTRRGVFSLERTARSTEVRFAPEWEKRARDLGIVLPSQVSPPQVESPRFDIDADLAAAAGDIPVGDLGESPFCAPRRVDS